MDIDKTVNPIETTPQTKEQIKFDDKVIKKIIASALQSVDGLLGTTGSFLGGITGILQKGNAVEEDVTRGIASEQKDGQVSVSIKMITEMGKSIPTIANDVTLRVTEALRDVAGLETKAVNVEVVDTMTRAEYEEKNAKNPPKQEEIAEEASK